MFDASDQVIQQLADALFKAGLYVGHSDPDRGDQAFDLRELQSLSVFLHTLKQETLGEGDLLPDVVKRVHNLIRDHGNPLDFSDDYVEALSRNLENTPAVVSQALWVAIESFSKEESKLYAQIVLSLAACMAQANYEKGNGSLFERVIADLVAGFEKPISGFLYESDDSFDHAKIGPEEERALDDLNKAICSIWYQKFPKEKPAL